MAEGIERARFEHLRGGVWTDLREGERTARTDVARQALEHAGVTALVAALTARAQRADELEILVTQRDAELARRYAEHGAEVATLEAQVADLERRLAASRAESADERARRERADAVLAAVRTVVEAGARPPDDTDAATAGAQSEDDAEPAAPPAARGRLPRLRSGSRR